MGEIGYQISSNNLLSLNLNLGVEGEGTDLGPPVKTNSQNTSLNIFRIHLTIAFNITIYDILQGSIYCFLPSQITTTPPLNILTTP